MIAPLLSSTLQYAVAGATALRVKMEVMSTAFRV